MREGGDAIGQQFSVIAPRSIPSLANIGTNGAIAVGGYIALAGLWAAPITGALMNPAR